MSDETTRRGKIARMPAAIRAEVCARLHDGQTAPKIIAWLHTLPEVLTVLDEHFHEQPLNEQNITEWRQGGYQDWLAKREKVENLRQLSNYAFDLAKAGGSVTDGAAAVAGGKILEFLETAEEEDVVGLSIALAKLRDSEAKKMMANTAHANLERKDRQLDLDEKKYQRSTAEMFLKWAKSPEAQAIISSGEKPAVQMDKLVQLMFGDRPT
jgi:hypothetical protein